MKKNYLSTSRAFMLMGLMLCVSMSGYAQWKHHNVRNLKAGSNDCQSEMIVDYSNFQPLEGCENLFVPKQKAMRKDKEAETVQVTFRLDKERPEYRPSPHIFAVDAKSNRYLGDFDAAACPKGTYDFTLFAEVASGGLAFVIKENIEITKDTTIIFDLSEAKNKISIELYKRNGELASPCIYKETDKGYDIIDEGDECWGVFSFARKGTIGGMSGTLYNQMSVDQTDPDITFYVNDASDNYTIGYCGEIRDEGDVFFFANGTEGMKAQNLSNQADDYVFYEEQFMIPPSFGQSEHDGSVGMEAKLVVWDHVTTGIQTKWNWEKLSMDGKVGMYVNCPTSIANGNVNMLMFPLFGDTWEEISGTYMGYDDEGNEIEVPYTNYNYAWQTGAPAKVSKDGIEYVVTYDASFFASGSNENDELMAYYPGHPHFSFTNKEKTLPYGENCPITAMWISNGSKRYQDVKNSDIYLKFIGRHSEFREGMNHIEETIKLDGEVLVSGITEHWQIGQKTMGIEEGVIDMELINRNVYVDGLQGKNTVTLQYDAAREDWTPPVLTMLQFRDMERNVTDRFETASEGIVTFSCGDKQFHPGYYFDYFTINNDMSVEVSYSPFNKDEWEKLEGIEEVPEYYYYPEFGYFYRGSLKDVTGQAEKGWFDLKIKLTDMAGNWQEQVISPAFRIDDLVDTGISQLRIDNGQLTIPGNETVYDVMGRRVADKSSKAMKGIQIVRRQNGDVRKVVVR